MDIPETIKEIADAEKLLEQREKLYGSNSPQAARVMRRLAKLLREQNTRLEEASRLEERASLILDQGMGEVVEDNQGIELELEGNKGGIRDSLIKEILRSVSFALCIAASLTFVSCFVLGILSHNLGGSSLRISPILCTFAAFFLLAFLGRLFLRFSSIESISPDNRTAAERQKEKAVEVVGRGLLSGSVIGLMEMVFQLFIMKEKITKEKEWENERGKDEWENE